MKRKLLLLMLGATCVTTWLFAQQDSMKSVQLDMVTITAQDKKKANQLVNFYKTNLAATLEDIMARLPEVALVRRGPYGMEPVIRSFSGGQINVMVDGMVIHGACTDKMDPATIYIEPMNLENLHLQTGTQGFSKGSAIGGTVDMKMAAPKFAHDKALHGKLQTGYQSNSQGWYNAGVLNYNTDRWAFRMSGTFRSHQNYTDGNGKEVLYSQFHKTNFSLATVYKLNYSTLLKADVLADDGRNMGYPALPMDVGSAKARLAALSIEQAHHSKRWYQWNAKLYMNDIVHQMDDSKRVNVPMHMDMPGHSNTVGAYGEGSYHINASQTLQMRVDAASTSLKASMTMYPAGEPPMYMLTWPDNRRNQVGMSGQWQWQPDSIHTLTVQMRLDAVQSLLTTEQAKDHISVAGGNTAPRFDFLKNVSFSYRHRVGRHHSVSANAALAQRRPTATELYGFYLFNAFDGFDYIGNTGLKTENAFNAEMGWQWKTNNIRVQATAFYSYLTHYLLGVIDPSFSPMTIGAKGVKVYQNLPQANLYGAEAALQWKITGGLALVSTLRSTVASDNKGKPLPLIPPLKNITSLRYAINKVFAQLECESAAAQNRVNASVGEMATPGYALLHARVGYNATIWQKQFSVQAGIENMLDAAYREHLDWGNVLRPGRNIYLQLKYSF
jgi:iron complex outermembrane receptor protein